MLEIERLIIQKQLVMNQFGHFASAVSLRHLFLQPIGLDLRGGQSGSTFLPLLAAIYL